MRTPLIITMSSATTISEGLQLFPTIMNGNSSEVIINDPELAADHPSAAASAAASNSPGYMSSSSSSSSSEEVYERNESLAKVEITVLSIILMIAIVGNSLMLIALRRQLLFRPMSRMYFFMLNLSIADLFVAFGNILPQLAWDITYRFQGNDLLCRMVKFLQVFVLYVSTYILTAMAIDRYLVVCHHSFSRNYYSGLKGPKILVAVAYIFSFILATPQAFLFSYMEIPGTTGVSDCWVKFIEPWGEKAYVTFFVVCAFIFPLLIIGASYGAISCKVIRFSLPKDGNRVPKAGGCGIIQSVSGRNRKHQYSFSSSSERTKDEQETDTVDEIPLRKQMPEERGSLRRQISQAKLKTLKLTLTVVICFFVCWAPFCITQLIITYNPQNAGPLQVIFLLLASLNSCTNPWIYLAFSESLCNQLRVSLGFGLRRASDEESIGDDKEPHNVNGGRKHHRMDGNERAAGKRIPIAVLSDNHARNGDHHQPETKSDFV